MITIALQENTPDKRLPVRRQFAGRAGCLFRDLFDFVERDVAVVIEIELFVQRSRECVGVLPGFGARPQAVRRRSRKELGAVLWRRQWRLRRRLSQPWGGGEQKQSSGSQRLHG